MAKLGTRAIRERAIEIVRKNPGGIRYTDIVKEILRVDPETMPNTISGSIWDLDKTCPTAVAKPSRGLYVPVSASTGETIVVEILPQTIYAEEDFYEPFADFLRTELGEATIAVAVGGAGFQKNGERQTLLAFTSHWRRTESSLIRKSLPRKSRSILPNQ